MCGICCCRVAASAKVLLSSEPATPRTYAKCGTGSRGSISGLADVTAPNPTNPKPSRSTCTQRLPGHPDHQVRQVSVRHGRHPGHSSQLLALRQRCARPRTGVPRKDTMAACRSAASTTCRASGTAPATRPVPADHAGPARPGSAEPSSAAPDDAERVEELLGSTLHPSRPGEARQLGEQQRLLQLVVPPALLPRAPCRAPHEPRRGDRLEPVLATDQPMSAGCGSAGSPRSVQGLDGPLASGPHSDGSRRREVVVLDFRRARPAPRSPSRASRSTANARSSVAQPGQGRCRSPAGPGPRARRPRPRGRSAAHRAAGARASA